MRALPSRRSWPRPRRPRPRRRHRRPQRSSVMGRRRILGRLGAALTCAAGVLLAVATAASVLRATVSYQTPAVMLVRADGKSVSLPHELDDGRPVLLNFIFTTCSSICPLTSRTLEEFQQQLGRAAAKGHMVSISIAAEQDTPARVAECARTDHARPAPQTRAGR